VYGDLKLSNCVFSSANEVYNAVLIDFDFVGSESQRYCSTFNVNIDAADGKRHSTATPKSLLRKEHDIFAFHYICSLFHADSVHWSQACSFLEQYQCDHAVNELELCADLNLTLKNASSVANNVSAIGTGSPNKDTHYPTKAQKHVK
jgi:hypothetical protein